MRSGACVTLCCWSNRALPQLRLHPITARNFPQPSKAAQTNNSLIYSSAFARLNIVCTRVETKKTLHRQSLLRPHHREVSPDPGAPELLDRRPLACDVLHLAADDEGLSRASANEYMAVTLRASAPTHHALYNADLEEHTVCITITSLFFILVAVS